MFIATFNNISDISWLSVLLVEETEVPKKNYHMKLYQEHLAMGEIRAHNVSGDKHR